VVSRIIQVFGPTLLLATIPGSALAVTPIALPEPASITMFAAAGGALVTAYIIKRWIGRK
jgi:hypothetical protein